MTRDSIQSVFFLALLVCVLVLVFLIFKPYLAILAVAAIFAFVMQPVFKRLTRVTFGNRTIAAMLTVIFTAVVVLLPLALIGFQIVSEAQDMYETLSTNRDTYFQSASDFIDSYLKPWAPSLDIDIQNTIQQVVGWLFQNLGLIFSGTLEVIVGVILGAVAFFYLLKDGSSFVQSLISISPLPDRHDHQIVDRLGQAVGSVLRGSLLVALIQGTLTGIGFAIFGIPHAALWGSLAAIGALVPGIGTSVILIPGVIYLILSGKAPMAIGLGIWGMFAVGLIDNLLGPYLVGRGVRLHPLLILFSVLGGLSFFGPLGFLFGPIVLSLLAALIEISHVVFLKKKIS